MITLTPIFKDPPYIFPKKKDKTEYTVTVNWSDKTVVFAEKK